MTTPISQTMSLMQSLEEEVKQRYISELESEPVYAPTRAAVLSAATQVIYEAERELCRRDPLRWLLRWVYTKDEAKQQTRRFPWKPHIVEFLNRFLTEKLLIVIKSRKMLMTWVMCALSVWMAQFNKNTLVIIQTQREQDAEALIERCVFILDNQPEFLRQPYKMRSKPCDIRFHDNGSRILGIPKGENVIRMHTASMVYIDEAAFVDNLEKSIAATNPCIMGGGKLVMVSTVQPSYFIDLVEDMVDEEDDEDF